MRVVDAVVVLVLVLVEPPRRPAVASQVGAGEHGWQVGEHLLLLEIRLGQCLRDAVGRNQHLSSCARYHTVGCRRGRIVLQRMWVQLMRVDVGRLSAGEVGRDVGPGVTALGVRNSVGDRPRSEVVVGREHGGLQARARSRTPPIARRRGVPVVRRGRCLNEVVLSLLDQLCDECIDVSFRSRPTQDGCGSRNLASDLSDKLFGTVDLISRRATSKPADRDGHTVKRPSTVTVRATL